MFHVLKSARCVLTYYCVVLYVFYVRLSHLNKDYLNKDYLLTYLFSHCQY